MNQSAFKIIVVSSPDNLSGEGAIINELFDAGLHHFHLRKPSSSEMEIQHIIDEVSPKYHDKIILHHKLNLAKDNNLKRLHINYSFFKTNGLSRELRKKFKFSCSVHSWKEYQEVKDIVEYVFISPVFDSISKPDYVASIQLHEVPKDKGAEIIALGGINCDNIVIAKEIGFDGAAVLGAIWENPLKAKDNFLALHTLFQNQIA